MFARLTRQVLDIARKEEVCRRLMSAPGVRPITALAFPAIVDRPERFGSSRAVGPHLGLTPARCQSGETDIRGKVSRRGDELARTALYEAAHSLLVRSKKWSSLRAWGVAIARRRGMARARVAVARKLVVIPHRIGPTRPSSALESEPNPELEMVAWRFWRSSAERAARKRSLEREPCGSQPANGLKRLASLPLPRIAGKRGRLIGGA